MSLQIEWHRGMFLKKIKIRLLELYFIDVFF